MTDLVQHPEYEALQTEIKRLQAELAHALGELDQMRTHTRPYLLALYQQTIGHAELACLRAQCKAEWLRRFIEHVQAARNRGAPPILEHIEAELDRELTAYWTGLRDGAAKVEAAQRLLGSLMTPEKGREFRQLYLRLVKRLHPDVNPLQGDRERLYWVQVQRAYEASDMEELLVIWQGIESLPSSEAPGALDELQRRSQRLLDEIRRVRARLEALERQPPFDLRDRLADDTWVQERLKQVDTARRGYEDRASLLRAQLRVLVGDAYDGLELQFGSH